MKYTDDSERLVHESFCPGTAVSKIFYRISETETHLDTILTKIISIQYSELGLITTIVNAQPRWKTPITTYNYSSKGLNNITHSKIKKQEIISVINLISQREGLHSNWNDTDEYNINYTIEQTEKSIIIRKKIAHIHKEDTYSCHKTEDNKIDIRLVQDQSLWRQSFVYNYHCQVEFNANYAITVVNQKLPSKLMKHYYYNSEGIPNKEVVIQLIPDRSIESHPLNPYPLISDTSEIIKPIYDKYYYR